MYQQQVINLMCNIRTHLSMDIVRSILVAVRGAREGEEGLPDNCAPYVIIYTGAQFLGSGAQLSGPGAQLSGPGAQLSAILVCIPTYVISAPLCMYRSLEAPSKTSDTIFWVAVMRWSAAFLFRELKKVDFSSMRLSGAWLCGLEPWLRALLVSRSTMA